MIIVSAFVRPEVLMDLVEGPRPDLAVVMALADPIGHREIQVDAAQAMRLANRVAHGVPVGDAGRVVPTRERSAHRVGPVVGEPLAYRERVLALAEPRDLIDGPPGVPG
jgi:hypothetical protein